MKSLLFAPGNQPDVLAKLPRSLPSAAVIDLEDATPPEQKEQARKIAVSAANQLATTLPLLVRINGLETSWFAEDIAHGLTQQLAGVVVPKLTSAAEVAKVADALDDAGLANLNIMAGLETVAGVVQASDVTSHPRVHWCYFGAEDYIADLGGVRRPDNLEVLMARSQVGQAARLGGAVALDMVVTDFSDDQRFTRESQEARALGFAGKLCIHPRQVALANEAFMPSPEELSWAKQVVEAYQKGLSEGQASIAVNGEMVDEPVARRAQALLDQTK